LVPGLTEADLDEDGFFDHHVVIDYRADRPLDWEVSDGGTMAPADGGTSTPGSCGTWPIPDGARTLTFDITGFETTSGAENERPDGTLTVDLISKTATRTPRT
jgi:hypothetical protein